MISSTLTTASASSVVLINGASPCNVYWQVGSSATLGSTTAFQGTLMALSSISLNNGATVLGRMLARNGQVSLINNVLSRPSAAPDPAGGDQAAEAVAAAVATAAATAAATAQRPAAAAAS